MLVFVFSLSLSYVRPGTRFDPTESQLGRTKREKNRFQCNEIILKVSSQLFYKDHATSVRYWGD